MINLMYLVLTAMLALNVSSEILHAFKIINASILKSNESVAGKNYESLRDLQANQDMQGHGDRVKPYNDKAKLVDQKSKELFDYLEDWKKKIIMTGGGYNPDPGHTTEPQREENIDASTKLLVEDKGGDEVKGKLQALRNFLLAQVSDSARKNIEKDLPLQITNPPASDNNPTGDWSRGTFYNVPVLGAITLFAKLQSDVRNSEAIILRQLSEEAESIPLKFDAIKAIAVPHTSYVLQGQPVTADIMVAAYNRSVNPQISASSGAVKVEAGIGNWTGTASGIGMQTVHGTLKINLGDRSESKDWSFEYMVGTAGASVQLDKMNVFYIGVDNPITVTAAGYNLEDVSVTIPGANLTNTGKGKYNVSIPASSNPPATVEANIMANEKGGRVSVGKMLVRVKRIPDPEGVVNGKSGSFGMPANIFRAQSGVASILRNFDFDAKFQTVSFDFSYQQRRKDYQGPLPVNSAYFEFNPQVKAYVRGQAGPGDKVYIDNIRAKGPDGSTRALSPIIINLF